MQLVFGQTGEVFFEALWVALIVQRGDEYKLKVVKSYYKFAKLSFEEKQIERYEKVISEYQDFADRYPDSKLLKEAESYSNLSQNHIKEIKNEQTTSSAKR